MNWLFLMILASLGSISYTSVLSSFHQFITNPREEDINKTENSEVCSIFGSEYDDILASVSTVSQMLLLAHIQHTVSWTHSHYMTL